MLNQRAEPGISKLYLYSTRSQTCYFSQIFYEIPEIFVINPYLQSTDIAQLMLKLWLICLYV